LAPSFVNQISRDFPNSSSIKEPSFSVDNHIPSAVTHVGARISVKTLIVENPLALWQWPVGWRSCNGPLALLDIQPKKTPSALDSQATT
jgi:hypothetical protein